MKERAKPVKELPKPYLPVEYTDTIVYALQAVARGDANDIQQRLAMRFIIEEMAGAYEFTFREDSRLSAFADGRRFVGLQLVKLIKMNIGTIKKAENDRADPTANR